VEVLKLRPKDVEDRRAIIRDPKSGKEAEVAFLPQKVADRLQKYISDKGIKLEDKIFPITYFGVLYLNPATFKVIVISIFKESKIFSNYYLKPYDTIFMSSN
jgi:integrase